MQKTFVVVLLVVVALACAGCASAGGGRSVTGQRGYLLAIGGGLDDDNRPVYELFIKRAREATAAGERLRIVIATAASGDEAGAAVGKTESIRAYAPDAEIMAVGRETATEETIARIEACSAMFFTGGDQKRITTRYRPGDVDGPEMAAMRALLMRGGVIAGTSAGDAMMGAVMFHTGRSAEALGVRSTRTRPGADDDADERRSEVPLGPQIGPGMGLMPWAMMDSHFFERDRFGRLVAALETSGTRLGIGVGEDAAVEVDLADGVVRGVSVADSLLVDAGAVRREGVTRRGILTRVIRQGMCVPVIELAGSPPDTRERARPAGVEEVPVVEPGQNRQLASWRFFRCAEEAEAGRGVSLRLDGYRQTGWSAGEGWAVVEIEAEGLGRRE